MPAVKKPAANGKGKGDWFHKKSPAAQKAYIAKHPNSIYAKQAKKEGATPAKGRGRAKVGTDPVLAEKYSKMLDKMHDKEPNPGTKAHEKWAEKEREVALKHMEAKYGTKAALQLKKRWDAAAAKRAKAKTSGTSSKKLAVKKSPELKKLEAAHKALERSGPRGVPKTPAEMEAYAEWRKKIKKSAEAIRKETEPSKKKRLASPFKTEKVKKVSPAASKPKGRKGPKNVEPIKKELAKKIKAAEKSIEKAKTKVGKANARARMKKYKEMLASYSK